MTLNDLTVEGLPPNPLTNITIAETLHNHGICDLTFTLPANFDPATILQWNKTKVTVKAKTKDKTDIIFCGLVSFCKLDERPEGKILFVRVLTLSCQLESAIKSKLYQSKKKKRSDIVNDVKQSYAGAQFDIWRDKKDDEIFYRDNLTDWDFLKSFAERIGHILFVNSKTDKLWLSVGYKAFAKFKCDKEKTKLVRQVLPMDFYKRLEQNTYAEARSLYFLETDLVTPELKIGVGSEVTYDDRKLAVIASRIYVDGVNLFNEIKLRDPKGCRADAWDVMKHFDEFYFLTGKVLESEGTNVKIKFDEDDTKSKSDALKIPFETCAGNYLYTMPDDGEKIFVYVDKIRNAALLTLRTNEVGDDYKNRSFKIKTASLLFDPKKFSFAAEDKTEMTHDEKGTSLKTNQDITFFAKGDIYIQSAQGLVPDNQLKMAAPQMAGYAPYTAALGQPSSVQFNPEGSTVGKVDTEIQKEGVAAEKFELSDLAKELDKITGRKYAKQEEKKSEGGEGGTLKFNATKDSTIQQVQDSSIALDGSKFNLKTRVFNKVAYIPAAGGGTGSLSKFEGGNPGNRSAKINVEHGDKDRNRTQEKIQPLPDDKNLSAG